MQDGVRRSVRVGLFSVLIFIVSGASASHAQSGSTGGSIGNDEKSVSGTRASPRAVESERPARRSRPRAEPEEPRRAARKSGGSGGGGASNFDGAWVVTATGCGGTTTSTVVVTSGKIIGEGVRGTISPNGVSHAVGNYNGVTVTSTGRTSGRRGTGTFRTSDGCTGTLTSVKQ